jgi:hypothetical protein
MMRGNLLENDLRLLINNPKYSDIEILCENKIKLYGIKAILAARSEVLDKLLYNGMKESYEKQISFSNINSSVMEIILEYIYTGSIKKESLTKDNMIEVFFAADYFQLLNLQEIIINLIKDMDYAAELLSKFIEMMPLLKDHILLNSLIDKIAVMKLNTIEFGKLSIAGLQYLLSDTYEAMKPFETTEYEVFRYSAILVAKKVSSDAFETLMERLPTLEHLENSTQVENKSIPDQQKIAKELKPLIKFIDFSKIKGKVLADIIEPLKIIPTKIITNAYRQKSRLDYADTHEIRGIRNIDESVCVWIDSKVSGLSIEENCKVANIKNDDDLIYNIAAKMIIDSTGIFEWDVIIEEACSDDIWIGVCENWFYEDNNDVSRDDEEYGYDEILSTQWLLSSYGSCHNYDKTADYCPSFRNDIAKITVHLDMNKRACKWYKVSGSRMVGQIII